MKYALCLLSAFLGACAGSLTTATSVDAVPAHDVLITATVASRSASGDSVVIHLSNSGTQPAYISRCGSQPLLLVQEYSGTTWTGGVQNFMCLTPSAPGPVRLGPGESTDLFRLFSSAGRYRMIATVASAQDLSDGVTATSNSFDIP